MPLPTGYTESTGAGERGRWTKRATVVFCLLAGLFLWSGIGKIAGYDEAGQFMVQHGTIGLLLPVAIAVEIGGAALLVAAQLLGFLDGDPSEAHRLAG